MSSGTGVPPDAIEQDAQGTIHKRQGNYLPHWTRDGATYAVTFRLGDSLPQKALESWLFERRDILITARQMDRSISKHEEKRLQELHSERVETYLDAGHGVCWLQQPAIAQLVADALAHFAATGTPLAGATPGPRYRLHAWCVMPNHVHVGRHTAAGPPTAFRPAQLEILHRESSESAAAKNGRFLAR